MNKKLGIIIAVIVIVVGGWFVINNRDASTPEVSGLKTYTDEYGFEINYKSEWQKVEGKCSDCLSVVNFKTQSKDSFYDDQTHLQVTTYNNNSNTVLNNTIKNLGSSSIEEALSNQDISEYNEVVIDNKNTKTITIAGSTSWHHYFIELKDGKTVVVSIPFLTFNNHPEILSSIQIN